MATKYVVIECLVDPHGGREPLEVYGPYPTVEDALDTAYLANLKKNTDLVYMVRELSKKLDKESGTT